MIISDFAIKRPMITVVTMVALVVFGLFALWRLQTDEFPDIQQPVVLTFIPYPGASPEGVERGVLKPVEDAIKEFPASTRSLAARATDTHRSSRCSSSRRIRRSAPRTFGMRSRLSDRTCRSR